MANSSQLEIRYFCWHPESSVLSGGETQDVAYHTVSRNKLRNCGWQKDGTVARNSLLLRLLPSGVADATFGTNGFRVLFALGELNALTLRGDGALVAAGAYQGDVLLAVLRRSGTWDLLFASDNDGRTFNLGGTDAINAVSVQSNGRIVISGSSLAGSNLRAVSAGITSTGVFDTSFGKGGATYHNFLQEFNAANQTRVETAATLPDGKLLAGGGLFGFGYSGAVLHRLEADPALHPIETLRLANFGSRVNSGASADAADPDLDGVPNLAEYAFNQNPNHRLSRSIPLPAIKGGNFVLAFPDPDDAHTKKVSFRAEASAFLTSGSWQQLPDPDTTGAYFFGIPMSTNPRAFMRLQVDLQP